MPSKDHPNYEASVRGMKLASGFEMLVHHGPGPGLLSRLQAKGAGEGPSPAPAGTAAYGIEECSWWQPYLRNLKRMGFFEVKMALGLLKAMLPWLTCSCSFQGLARGSPEYQAKHDQALQFARAARATSATVSACCRLLRQCRSIIQQLVVPFSAAGRRRRLRLWHTLAH